MLNNRGGHAPDSKVIPYLLYFYAFISCISIAGSNGGLVLLTLVFLYDWWKTKSVGSIRKDFFLFAAIYGWKGITLIANGLITKVYRIREVWDKVPYLVISRYRISGNELRKSLHILFITNSVLIIYAFLQKFFNVPIIFKSLFDGIRMEGYFGNALHYGGYITIVLLVCLSLIFFYRVQFAIYLPFLLGGLILSGCRGYYISVILAVLLLAYFKSRRALASALLAFPVLLIIGVNLSADLSGRLFSILEKSNWQVRMDYWPVAWETYKEYPLFGVGYDEFSSRLAPLVEAGVVRNASHAHNIYLQELVEGGPIGLFLISFTMIWFIRKYYLYFTSSDDLLLTGMSLGLSASFLALMIAGFGEYNFGTAAIWLLITFLMGICEAYRNGLIPAHEDVSIA